jgi:hypothetical protein
VVLRDEIVELIRLRSDFFKWKLILIAGLGAAASGLVGSSRFPRPGFLLALIPLVSLYVDVLSLDLTLRIVVIAKYFQELRAGNATHDENDGRYQDFVAQATAMESNLWQIVKDAPKRWTEGISAYAFFSWAQNFSTLIFSFGTVVGGLALGIPHRDQVISNMGGAIGVVGNVLIYFAYANRFSAVQRLSLGATKTARQ